METSGDGLEVERETEASQGTKGVGEGEGEGEGENVGVGEGETVGVGEGLGEGENVGVGVGEVSQGVPQSLSDVVQQSGRGQLKEEPEKEKVATSQIQSGRSPEKVFPSPKLKGTSQERHKKKERKKKYTKY